MSDLANAHIRVAEKIEQLPSYMALNIGTGQGTTVFELIKTFEKVNHKKIPFKIERRRPGDVAQSVADPSLSLKLLQIKCKHSIEDMCRHSWNWQKQYKL